MGGEKCLRKRRIADSPVARGLDLGGSLFEQEACFGIQHSFGRRRSDTGGRGELYSSSFLSGLRSTISCTCLAEYLFGVLEKHWLGLWRLSDGLDFDLP